MLGYTGASTPLYPPQRYRAWSGWSQPKALGHHRLNPGPGLVQPSCGNEGCHPILGYLARNQPQSFRFCSAQQRVREAVAVQRKLYRENLLLPSGTSSAAAQKSESCIPISDHTCWCPKQPPQAAAPFVSPDCRNPTSPLNHNRIPYSSLQKTCWNLCLS